MIVLPIIERELRAQSRLGFTYGLRVLGAAALLLVSLLFTISFGLPADRGGELFGCLNCTLFISIWALVPILAADCLSRERREGTLGLLFMTPLKAGDIVLAKGLVHGLRALTLWLAALPIMTIPFLLGGVGWNEGLVSVLVNFSAICWALSAGLLASSLAKSWLRAQIIAWLLGGCFAFGFIFLTGFTLVSLAGPSLSLPYWSVPYQRITVPSDQILPAGFFGATDFGGWWAGIFNSTTGTKPVLLFSESLMAILSVLMLVFAIGFAAWRLRRVWQEEPKSARRLWLEQKLCTPVIWADFLRRWMRRKLDRNPIGWLEQRTWSGRLVMWSWFAVMITFYSAALGGRSNLRMLDSLESLMAWLLLISMAASAAGSFQRERENGVMELLLVSPMTAGQIIGGRLRGLWGQFLPAAALQLGLWMYFGGVLHNVRNNDAIRFFCCSFLVLPVIGLFYSLRRRSFINAWLSTVLVGFLAPVALRVLLEVGLRIFVGYGFIKIRGISGGYTDTTASPILRFLYSYYSVILFQLIIAARLGWRLRRDMERRNFSFSRMIA
jgi:ABC-type transport system involved in multi-copper enzyme maturation permease subunit